MNGIKLGVVLVVVLVIAEINHWTTLQKVFVALAALFVVALVYSRLSLRGVALSRSTRADRAQVGQTVTERIRVENRSRVAKLWLEIVDHSDLPGHQMSRVIHLGPNDANRWRVETWCSRRGRFRLGPLTLRSGDPFDLFPTAQEIPHSQELLIYPATVDLSGFRLPVGILPGGNSIQRRTPFVTPNASGVRQYLPGDSFNRIAWTATARTGHLMVKEFELDPTSDVWIVLDLEAAHHVEAGRPGVSLPLGSQDIPLSFWLDSTEEYAVTIAASLARHFLDQNRTVGLLTNGQQPIVLPTDRGARQMVKVLELLAVAAADGTVPIAETLMAEGALFSRNSTVVVISPSTDERWVQAVMELIARHARVVAVVVEPSTFGASESSLMVVSDLAAVGVPTYLVKYGDDISRALTTQGHAMPIRRAS
ncbi:MAG TPA: DUF58 domain-containing protein [Nitrolancea sp.]|nr:DUF58 domain-containing protein [Nitrolancea sp.]